MKKRILSEFREEEEEEDEEEDNARRLRAEGPSYVRSSSAGNLLIAKKRRVITALRNATDEDERRTLQEDLDRLSLAIAYRRNAVAHAAVSLSKELNPIDMFTRSFADIYSLEELQSIVIDAKNKKR